MSEHDEQRPEREQRPALHPRIWIGSLADYNAGHLHGDWVDAAVDEDELVASAQRILATSKEPGAEEWGIFDYDDFGGFQVDEYEDLVVVARIARRIAQHGPAFAAWAELAGGDVERLDQFDEAFQGEFDKAEDWAQEVLDESALESQLDRAVPDSLRPYVVIDYPAFVRDCQFGGDIDVVAAPGGRVWVFRADV